MIRFRLQQRCMVLVFAFCVLSFHPACAEIARAQPVQSENIQNSSAAQIVALSDLIITGTVNSLSEFTDLYGMRQGLAIVTTDKVLKGPTTKEAQVCYPVSQNPSSERPQVPILQLHKKYLLALQRGQYGYHPVQGTQGIRSPLTDLGQFTQLASSIPLQVSFVMPSTPCYINQDTDLTVSMSSHVTADMAIQSVSIEGFFLSPKMGHTPPQTLVPIVDDKGKIVNGPDGYFTGPKVLKANEDVSFSLKIHNARPGEWQVIQPNTYICTPVAVRLIVTVQPIPTDPAKPVTPILVASPWNTVLYGYRQSAVGPTPIEGR